MVNKAIELPGIEGKDEESIINKFFIPKISPFVLHSLSFVGLFFIGRVQPICHPPSLFPLKYALINCDKGKGTNLSLLNFEIILNFIRKDSLQLIRYGSSLIVIF